MYSYNQWNIGILIRKGICKLTVQNRWFYLAYYDSRSV